MKSNKVFFWACDYNLNTGEGRLGRLYIKEYKKRFKKKPIIIKFSKSNILNYKYIIPFVGVFYSWLYFLNGKKFLFLNYIPYWNFIIFLLLAPKSEIGPITGGSKFSKYSNDFTISSSASDKADISSEEISTLVIEDHTFSSVEIEVGSSLILGDDATITTLTCSSTSNIEKNDAADAESRMRLRSIDVQMLHLMEDLASGRQEITSAIRSELNSLSGVIAEAKSKAKGKS